MRIFSILFKLFDIYLKCNILWNDLDETGTFCDISLNLLLFHRIFLFLTHTEHYGLYNHFSHVNTMLTDLEKLLLQVEKGQT